jgi:hypothetical protein
VVCRLDDWVDGSRMALGLGRESFAGLIGGLPKWEVAPVRLISDPARSPVSR